MRPTTAPPTGSGTSPGLQGKSPSQLMRAFTRSSPPLMIPEMAPLRREVFCQTPQYGEIHNNPTEKDTISGIQLLLSTLQHKISFPENQIIHDLKLSGGEQADAK